MQILDFFNKGVLTEPYARVVCVSEDKSGVFHVEIAQNGPILDESGSLNLNTDTPHVLYINQKYTSESVRSKGKPYDAKKEDLRLKKLLKTARAEGVHNTYMLLKQVDRLALSETEVFKELISLNFEVHPSANVPHVETKRSSLAPKDLNDIFQDFLELYPRADMQQERGHVSSIDVRRSFEDTVVDISSLVLKWGDLLKEVPGFYQIYDATINGYKWTYTKLGDCLIIPTKPDGTHITGLILRSMKKEEGYKTRYLNFSSSKRTRFPYEKYPTKAESGYNLQKLSDNDKVLWVVEGAFKGDACYINPKLAATILQIPEPDLILSVPGVGPLPRDVIPYAREIYLILDNDVNKSNTQLNKQAKSMLRSLGSNTKFILTPENPKGLKGIDDVIWSLVESTG